MQLEDLLSAEVNPFERGADAQSAAPSVVPLTPAAKLQSLDIESLDVPSKLRSQLVKLRRGASEAIYEPGDLSSFGGKFKEQWRRGEMRHQLGRAHTKIAKYMSKNPSPEAEEAYALLREIQSVQETTDASDPVNSDNIVKNAILQGAQSLPAMSRQILFEVGALALAILEPTPLGEAALGARYARHGFAALKAGRAAGQGIASGIQAGSKVAAAAGKVGSLAGKVTRPGALAVGYRASTTMYNFFPEHYSDIFQKVKDAGGSNEVANSYANAGGALSALVETVMGPGRLLGIQQGGFLSKGAHAAMTKALINVPVKASILRFGVERVIGFLGEWSEEGAQGGINNLAAFMAAEAERDPEVLNHLLENINEQLNSPDFQSKEGAVEIKTAWDTFWRSAYVHLMESRAGVAGLMLMGLPFSAGIEGLRTLEGVGLRKEAAALDIDTSEFDASDETQYQVQLRGAITLKGIENELAQEEDARMAKLEEQGLEDTANFEAEQELAARNKDLMSRAGEIFRAEKLATEASKRETDPTIAALRSKRETEKEGRQVAEEGRLGGRGEGETLDRQEQAGEAKAEADQLRALLVSRLAIQIGARQKRAFDAENERRAENKDPDKPVLEGPATTAERVMEEATQRAKQLEDMLKEEAPRSKAAAKKKEETREKDLDEKLTADRAAEEEATEKRDNEDRRAALYEEQFPNKVDQNPDHTGIDPEADPLDNDISYAEFKAAKARQGKAEVTQPNTEVARDVAISEAMTKQDADRFSKLREARDKITAEIVNPSAVTATGVTGSEKVGRATYNKERVAAIEEEMAGLRTKYTKVEGDGTVTPYIDEQAGADESRVVGIGPLQKQIGQEKEFYLLIDPDTGLTSPVDSDGMERYKPVTKGVRLSPDEEKVVQAMREKNKAVLDAIQEAKGIAANIRAGGKGTPAQEQFQKDNPDLVEREMHIVPLAEIAKDTHAKANLTADGKILGTGTESVDTSDPLARTRVITLNGDLGYILGRAPGSKAIVYELDSGELFAAQNMGEGHPIKEIPIGGSEDTSAPDGSEGNPFNLAPTTNSRGIEVPPANRAKHPNPVSNKTQKLWKKPGAGKLSGRGKDPGAKVAIALPGGLVVKGEVLKKDGRLQQFGVVINDDQKLDVGEIHYTDTDGTKKKTSLASDLSGRTITFTADEATGEYVSAQPVTTDGGLTATLGNSRVLTRVEQRRGRILKDAADQIEKLAEHQQVIVDMRARGMKGRTVDQQEEDAKNIAREEEKHTAMQTALDELMEKHDKIGTSERGDITGALTVPNSLKGMKRFLTDLLQVEEGEADRYPLTLYELRRQYEMSFAVRGEVSVSMQAAEENLASYSASPEYEEDKAIYEYLRDNVPESSPAQGMGRGDWWATEEEKRKAVGRRDRRGRTWNANKIIHVQRGTFTGGWFGTLEEAETAADNYYDAVVDVQERNDAIWDRILKHRVYKANKGKIQRGEDDLRNTMDQIRIAEEIALRRPPRGRNKPKGPAAYIELADRIIKEAKRKIALADRNARYDNKAEISPADLVKAFQSAPSIPAQMLRSIIKWKIRSLMSLQRAADSVAAVERTRKTKRNKVTGKRESAFERPDYKPMLKGLRSLRDILGKDTRKKDKAGKPIGEDKIVALPAVVSEAYRAEALAEIESAKRMKKFAERAQKGRQSVRSVELKDEIAALEKHREELYKEISETLAGGEVRTMVDRASSKKEPMLWEQIVLARVVDTGRAVPITLIDEVAGDPVRIGKDTRKKDKAGNPIGEDKRDTYAFVQTKQTLTEVTEVGNAAMRERVSKGLTTTKAILLDDFDAILVDTLDGLPQEVIDQVRYNLYGNMARTMMGGKPETADFTKISEQQQVLGDVPSAEHIESPEKAIEDVALTDEEGRPTRRFTEEKVPESQLQPPGEALTEAQTRRDAHLDEANRLIEGGRLIEADASARAAASAEGDEAASVKRIAAYNKSVAQVNERRKRADKRAEDIETKMREGVKLTRAEQKFKKDNPDLPENAAIVPPFENELADLDNQIEAMRTVSKPLSPTNAAKRQKKLESLIGRRSTLEEVRSGKSAAKSGRDTQDLILDALRAALAEEEKILALQPSPADTTIVGSSESAQRRRRVTGKGRATKQSRYQLGLSMLTNYDLSRLAEYAGVPSNVQLLSAYNKEMRRRVEVRRQLDIDAGRPKDWKGTWPKATVFYNTPFSKLEAEAFAELHNTTKERLNALARSGKTDEAAKRAWLEKDVLSHADAFESIGEPAVRRAWAKVTKVIKAKGTIKTTLSVKPHTRTQQQATAYDKAIGRRATGGTRVSVTEKYVIEDVKISEDNLTRLDRPVAQRIEELEKEGYPGAEALLTNLRGKRHQTKPLGLEAGARSLNKHVKRWFGVDPGFTDKGGEKIITFAGRTMRVTASHSGDTSIDFDTKPGEWHVHFNLDAATMTSVSHEFTHIGVAGLNDANLRAVAGFLNGNKKQGDTGYIDATDMTTTEKRRAVEEQIVLRNDEMNLAEENGVLPARVRAIWRKIKEWARMLARAFTGEAATGKDIFRAIRTGTASKRTAQGRGVVSARGRRYQAGAPSFTEAQKVVGQNAKKQWMDNGAPGTYSSWVKAKAATLTKKQRGPAALASTRVLDVLAKEVPTKPARGVSSRTLAKTWRGITYSASHHAITMAHALGEETAQVLMDDVEKAANETAAVVNMANDIIGSDKAKKLALAAKHYHMLTIKDSDGVDITLNRGHIEYFAGLATQSRLREAVAAIRGLSDATRKDADGNDMESESLEAYRAWLQTIPDKKKRQDVAKVLTGFFYDTENRPVNRMVRDKEQGDRIPEVDDEGNLVFETGAVRFWNPNGKTEIQINSDNREWTSYKFTAQDFLGIIDKHMDDALQRHTDGVARPAFDGPGEAMLNKKESLTGERTERIENYFPVVRILEGKNWEKAVAEAELLQDPTTVVDNPIFHHKGSSVVELRLSNLSAIQKRMYSTTGFKIFSVPHLMLRHALDAARYTGYAEMTDLWKRGIEAKQSDIIGNFGPEFYNNFRGALVRAEGSGDRSDNTLNDTFRSVLSRGVKVILQSPRVWSYQAVSLLSFIHEFGVGAVLQALATRFSAESRALIAAMNAANPFIRERRERANFEQVFGDMTRYENMHMTITGERPEGAVGAAKAAMRKFSDTMMKGLTTMDAFALDMGTLSAIYFVRAQNLNISTEDKFKKATSLAAQAIHKTQVSSNPLLMTTLRSNRDLMSATFGVLTGATNALWNIAVRDVISLRRNGDMASGIKVAQTIAIMAVQAALVGLAKTFIGGKPKDDDDDDFQDFLLNTTTSMAGYLPGGQAMSPAVMYGLAKVLNNPDMKRKYGWLKQKGVESIPFRFLDTSGSGLDKLMRAERGTSGSGDNERKMSNKEIKELRARGVDQLKRGVWQAADLFASVNTEGNFRLGKGLWERYISNTSE